MLGSRSLRQPLVQGCARPAGHPASHSLRPAGNSTRQQLRGPRKGTCSTAPPTGFSRLHPVPATDGGLLLTSAENNPSFHLPGFNLLTNQGPSCEGVGLLLVAKTKRKDFLRSLLYFRPLSVYLLVLGQHQVRDLQNRMMGTSPFPSQCTSQQCCTRAQATDSLFHREQGGG